MLAERPQYKLNHNEGNRQKRPTKAQIKRAKRNKFFNRLKTIVLATLFLIGSLLILSRYAKITAIRTEITELEKTIEDLEKDKLNLEAKLEGIKSSEEIANDAMVKLGMHYPRKDQIAYVAVEKETPKVQTKTDNVKTGFKEGFSRIKDFLGGIVGE